MEYPIVFHLEVLRIISKVSYIYISIEISDWFPSRESDRLGGISPNKFTNQPEYINQSTRVYHRSFHLEVHSLRPEFPVLLFKSLVSCGFFLSIQNITPATSWLYKYISNVVKTMP